MLQSPASSGDSPSTSCRYWATKTSIPKTTTKREQVRAERGAEAGLAEQAEVDHRIGEPPLPVDEHHADGEPGERRRDARPADAVARRPS